MLQTLMLKARTKVLQHLVHPAYWLPNTQCLEAVHSPCTASLLSHRNRPVHKPRLRDKACRDVSYPLLIFDLQCLYAVQLGGVLPGCPAVCLAAPASAAMRPLECAVPQTKWLSLDS